MKISSEKLFVIPKKASDTALILTVSALIGAVCGIIGAFFAKSIGFVTDLREANGFLVYLLPIGGLVSVGLYKLTKNEGVGTIRVLESARGGEKTPVLLMPVIFFASVITHLFGGSAGKEGAALQIGGTVAEAASKITHADDKKHSVYMICGMAALFSSVFGTPFGAWVFALEVVWYKKTAVISAIPALVSSIIAYAVSVAIGVVPERFEVHSVPDIGFAVIGKALLISAVVAVVSMVFCYLLRGGEKFFEKLFKNSFVRIFVGGCVIIVLTLIFGTDYNGGGMGIIERIFEEGIVKPEAFLLKIIFTAITVSSGFRGGEIVPSLFIGSTLGGTLSPFLGLSPDFGAATGMIAFFSGVTNCPFASAVISIELFGVEGILFFAVAAVAARLISGKKCLYN